MDVILTRYFTSNTKKVTCVLYIYLFNGVYIVNPSFYHSGKKEDEIDFEEKVDNAMWELYDKEFSLNSVEEEENIFNLLPEKLKYSSRIFRQDKNLNWNLLWNKLYQIFV